MTLPLRTCSALAALVVATAHAATPAEGIPRPRPEPCVPFDAEPEEGGMVAPDGLSYEQVRASLNAVLQKALLCPRPSGLSEAHLTYEFVVGCNGVVTSITTSDTGGAPDTYATCIAEVIARADFPGHDMADGMPITYPVNVAW